MYNPLVFLCILQSNLTNWTWVRCIYIQSHIPIDALASKADWLGLIFTKFYDIFYHLIITIFSSLSTWNVTIHTISRVKYINFTWIMRDKIISVEKFEFFENLVLKMLHFHVIRIWTIFTIDLLRESRFTLLTIYLLPNTNEISHDTIYHITLVFRMNSIESTSKGSEIIQDSFIMNTRHLFDHFLVFFLYKFLFGLFQHLILLIPFIEIVLVSIRKAYRKITN